MFKIDLGRKYIEEELEKEIYKVEMLITKEYEKKERLVQVYIVFMGLMLSCAIQCNVVDNLFSVFLLFLLFLISSIVYCQYLPCYSASHRNFTNLMAFIASVCFSFYVVSLYFYYSGYALSFDFNYFYFENFSLLLLLGNVLAYSSFFSLMLCFFMSLYIYSSLLYDFYR